MFGSSLNPISGKNIDEVRYQNKRTSTLFGFFRRECHKTADICEKGAKICEESHGPRTRRCHLLYKACKSRFFRLRNKKVDISPSSLTNSILIAAIVSKNDSVKVSLEVYFIYWMPWKWFPCNNTKKTVGVVTWSACSPYTPTIWIRIPLTPTDFSVKINKNRPG